MPDNQSHGRHASSRICLVPHTKLSTEALQNMIEQFVSRDGMDSGHVETALAQKVAMIRSQLNRGEVVIAFDPDTQTCNIVPTDQIPSKSRLSGN